MTRRYLDRRWREFLVIAGSSVAVLANQTADDDTQFVCMLPGENWGLTTEQQARWDALPECPDGAGKVNPHPDDSNYDPLAPAS